jgi:hypothetical protein
MGIREGVWRIRLRGKVRHDLALVEATRDKETRETLLYVHKDFVTILRRFTKNAREFKTEEHNVRMARRRSNQQIESLKRAERRLLTLREEEQIIKETATKINRVLARIRNDNPIKGNVVREEEKEQHKIILYCSTIDSEILIIFDMIQKIIEIFQRRVEEDDKTFISEFFGYSKKGLRKRSETLIEMVKGLDTIVRKLVHVK